MLILGYSKTSRSLTVQRTPGEKGQVLRLWEKMHVLLHPPVAAARLSSSKRKTVLLILNFC